MTRRPVRRIMMAVGMIIGVAVGGLPTGMYRDLLAPGAADCRRAGELTVVAGYDISIDRVQRQAVRSWSDHGYQARLVEVSPQTDDTRAQTVSSVACPYDVAVVDIAHLAEYAAHGHAAEIGPDDLPGGPRDFLPSMAEAGRWRGVRYGVPFFADAPLLYAKGAAEQVIDAVWRNAGGTSVRGAAVLQLADYEGGTVNLLEAAGGTGTAMFRDPERMPDGAELAAVLRPALDRWRDLLRQGVIDPASEEAREEEAFDRFRTAAAPAVLRQWSSIHHRLSVDDRLRDPETGEPTFTVRPLPGGILGGAVLAIAPDLPEERRRAALSLVDHLTRPEVQAWLFACGGYAPVVREAYEVNRYADLGFTKARDCLEGGEEETAGERTGRSATERFAGFARIVEQAVADAVNRPQLPYYSRFSEVFRTCARAVLQADGPARPTYYHEFAEALARAAEGRIPVGGLCGSP